MLGFHRCRLTTQILFAVMQLCFRLTQPCQWKIEYQTSRKTSFHCKVSECKITSGQHISLVSLETQIDHFIFYICKIVFRIQQDSSQTSKAVIMCWELGRERLPPSASPSNIIRWVKLVLHFNSNVKIQKYEAHL